MITYVCTRFPPSPAGRPPNACAAHAAQNRSLSSPPNAQPTLIQIFATAQSTFELIHSFEGVSWFGSAFGSTSPAAFEAMHADIDRDLQDLQVGVHFLLCIYKLLKLCVFDYLWIFHALCVLYMPDGSFCNILPTGCKSRISRDLKLKL